MFQYNNWPADVYVSCALRIYVPPYSPATLLQLQPEFIQQAVPDVCKLCLIVFLVSNLKACQDLVLQWGYPVYKSCRRNRDKAVVWQIGRRHLLQCS